jgi:hypothetical protein
VGILNSVKSSILGMRSEEAVSATSVARAKEATKKQRAEILNAAENRKMAASLKVNQLAESRRDKAEEDAAERAAAGNIDPEAQRQLMAAERVQAAVRDKAESIKQSETNQVKSTAAATREAGRIANIRKKENAERDDPNNAEHKLEMSRWADVAMGIKAYRRERDADEENQARPQKAAIIQRAMEAQQARAARQKGEAA